MWNGMNGTMKIVVRKPQIAQQPLLTLTMPSPSDQKSSCESKLRTSVAETGSTLEAEADRAPGQESATSARMRSVTSFSYWSVLWIMMVQDPRTHASWVVSS